MSEPIRPNIKGATSGIFGHVDFINEEGIGGWVLDLDKPDEPQVVELYIDNKKCAEAIANIPRPDISQIIGRELRCGFLIKWKDVPVEYIIGSRDFNIQLIHKTTFKKIAGKVKKINLTMTTILNTKNNTSVIQNESLNNLTLDEIQPEIDGNIGVYGHVDYIDDRGIGGWLYDFSMDGPNKIEVYINGRKKAEKLTDIQRDDIDKIVGKRTSCGFHVGFEDLNIKSFEELEEILNNRVDVKVLYNDKPIKSVNINSKFYDKVNSIIEEYKIIKELVDIEYYIRNYPEITHMEVDPVYHFITQGWKKGYKPNDYFDVDYYLTNYPDIKKAGVNPLRHYIEAGWKEGRNPSDKFKTILYLKANPDIKLSGVNPLEHYIKYGIKEGRSLFPFDEQGYVQSYFISILDMESQNSRCPYVEELNLENVKLPVRLIALYLPQFHPIPENDEWWGKGFTEWTNVTKTTPKFVGHYQPHLPIHFGFYDLRLKEVIKEQAELARKYGIYGFCFYFYYFGDKKLLETPLKILHENKDININYCIYWANENWTRRWDGLEKEVLIHQHHSVEGDKRFIHEIFEYLLDERYIKVDGRPLIIVYRVDKLAEPLETIEYWKNFCIRNGTGEPYLVAVQSFGFKDNPKLYGFDASMEYMHSWSGAPPNRNEFATFLSFDFEGVVYDYYDLVKQRESFIDSLDKMEYEIFHEVVPSWDNTARRKKNPVIFHNSNPYLYKKWLEKAISNTIKYKLGDNRIVFIDAWNEWAEGNHIEPDRKFGYGYLQATAEALSHFVDQDDLIKTYFYTTPKDLKNRVFYEKIDKDALKKESDTVVIVHMYYKDLYEEFVSYLRNIPEIFDIFFSIPVDVAIDVKSIIKDFDNAYIYRTINRGRDLYPMIEILRAIKHLKYKVGLKFHSKKSPHRWDGDLWRLSSLNCLIGSEKNAKVAIEILRKNRNVGLVIPSGQFVSTEYHMGSNREWLEKLSHMAGLKWEGENFFFPAGSFYWFNPNFLENIANLDISLEDFEPEFHQKDGCLQHAIERFIGLLAEKSGFEIYEINEVGTIKPAKPELYHKFAKPEKN